MRYCEHCGQPLSADARFCRACGHPQNPPPPPVIKETKTKGAVSTQPRPVSAILITMILTSAVLFGIFLLVATRFNWIQLVPLSTTAQSGISPTTLSPEISPTMSPSSQASQTPSASSTATSAATSSTTITQPSPSASQTAVVPPAGMAILSQGVDPHDTGNLSEGQFVFDDGQSLFYSTYDTGGQANICRINKATGQVIKLRQGFALSMAVHGDWLYFLGYPGNIEEGSEKIYRCRLDGSELELIVDRLSIHLLVYEDWLYYIRLNDSNDGYGIYRCRFDGSGEQLLLMHDGYFFQIYNQKLYFVDKRRELYQANLDGSEARLILSDQATLFFMSQGRLIYIDHQGQIKQAGLDGGNPQLIIATGFVRVRSLTSQGSVVYYTVMDHSGYDLHMTYHYSINRINLDGTNRCEVYRGITKDSFVNIVGDQIYLFDFAFDESLGSMVALMKKVGSAGGEAVALPR